MSSLRDYLVSEIAQCQDDIRLMNGMWREGAKPCEITATEQVKHALEAVLSELDLETIPRLNKQLAILGGYGVPYVKRDEIRDIITLTTEEEKQERMRDD